ncbi:hypothetical protein EMCG_08469 [[Emmonsia] crescens]|uniref:BTB domain-containing protein n=1 Tax=[Emmonsia] crescens TaxID=73230 RepID=A0A0G2I650_9EURO|nr:hypothetical protein EMCG_08469 [Emmonsia crescens UAMH 3008]
MSGTIPTDNFTALMISGKYSDLILKCQRTEFKVRRAIVCSQSPVLAAACDRDSKEATSNTIQIDGFDVETVKQMLQFMYTQTYSKLLVRRESNPMPSVTEKPKRRKPSHRILDTSWSPHGFHIVIEKAMRTTRDKDLHHILSVAAAAHVEDHRRRFYK